MQVLFGEVAAPEGTWRAKPVQQSFGAGSRQVSLLPLQSLPAFSSTATFADSCGYVCFSDGNNIVGTQRNSVAMLHTFASASSREDAQPF